MAAPTGFAALVALRVKSGELAALRALRETGQVRPVQPLLQFEPGGMAPAKQLEAIEAAVRHLHRLGRHVLLDASDVADLPAFGRGAVGALGQVADRLSHPADLLDTGAPIGFVPVIRSDVADAPAAALGRLCHELGIGGALRVRPDTADRPTVERVLARLGVAPADLDLIIDLQYVAEATPERIDRAGAVLAALAEVCTFRSRTLLSGSIPRQLARTATWEQPRAEEALWASLVRGGAEDLRLGDYGVGHPVPGPGYRSRHVTVKYTCSGHWLYSRERMTEEDQPGETLPDSGRAFTFRVVCRHLVESGSFAGPGFSWGDQEIHDAAGGRGRGFGSTSKPVALATSHHLAHLAARAAA